jgi:hypothetical protein
MQVKIQINKTRAVKKVTPQVKIDKKLKTKETGAKINPITYCGNIPSKNVAKANIPIGMSITFSTSLCTDFAFSFLGSPKKVIPLAFEKQTIAIVPAKAKPAIVITKTINKLISLAGIPKSIPA